MEGKQPLIKSFEDDERRISSISSEGGGRSQRREYVSLRTEDMEAVIAVACSEIHTSKAALDVMGQLHGTNNFKIMKKNLVQLEAILPALINEILRVRVSITAAEDILSHKDKFRSNEHFGCEVDAHGPAVHCHYFAFVEAEPCEGVEKIECGHYHVGTCDVCCEIENLAAILTNLDDKINTSGDEKAKTLNFAYRKQRFTHYAGHQGRLLHESQVANVRKDKMKGDTSLMYIMADYAMKFLTLKDSVAQIDFFGKAWHLLAMVLA